MDVIGTKIIELRRQNSINNIQNFFQINDLLLNFKQQPIYSDGLWAVFIFHVEHTPITEIELFHWELLRTNM
jgi:hypothetical protein